MAEARPEAEEYTRLLSTRSEREEQVNAAEAQHDALKQRIDSITKTKKDLSEAERESKILKEDLALRELAVKERRLVAERTTRDLEDKRKELADMKMVKSYVIDLRHTLDEGPLTDRRAFIRSFIKEIAVTQQEIRLNYTLPY